MRPTEKFLAVSAICGVLLFAAVGGHAVRGMVDLGRWPLVAQGESPVVSDPRMPISTDPGYAKGSEATYFYAVADLLQREYVEPVSVDEKMAVGAVKGMVNSLSDPMCRFFDEETYPSFLARERGDCEGIGVEVTLDYDKEALDKLQHKKQLDPLSLLPRPIVTCVYPGSPAEAAGLRPGDQVTKLNGKFVLTVDDVKQIRKMQEEVTAKRADPAELGVLQNELFKKAKETMSAMRARDLLYRLEKQPVNVEWKRGGQAMTASIKSASVKVKPLEKLSAGTYRLRFVNGAEGALSAEPLPDGAVIDLRNSGHGNFNTMLSCLKLVSPAGKLGDLVSERGKTPLSNGKAGTVTPSHWTLLVDQTTLGAAAVFARTLASLHLATMQGEPAESMDWVEPVDVNGRSGYTLSTGQFEPATLGGSK